MDLSGSGKMPMAGCQECSKGPLGNKNRVEFLDCHSECSVLKKGAIQWSETVAIIRMCEGEVTLASQNVRSLTVVLSAIRYLRQATYYNVIMSRVLATIVAVGEQ